MFYRKGIFEGEKMRKKDILGNFVKNTNVVYDYSIKKLTGENEAYTAFITFLPGCRELYVDNEGERYCLAGPGFKWLMYLPLDEFWCITAFYNPQNELLEWYFDISKGNFIDENGIPCTDDIFLDLVVLPNGKTITVDADELQEALDKNEITVDDYHHAYQVRDQILNSKWINVDFLKEQCRLHVSEYAGRGIIMP